MLTDGTETNEIMKLLSNKPLVHSGLPKVLLKLLRQPVIEERRYEEREEGVYQMLSCCALRVKDNQGFCHVI